MSSPPFEHKLAAIIYADVAGYSRLTGEDEAGTHRTLSSYLDLFTTAIERHHGNVVHYAGDAILAAFGMASDALTCAISVQQELDERDTNISDEQRVRFRIGVNLGEVIVDRDDIYGEGVNIAARLEGLAEPGGVCVSEAVRNAVGGKLPLEYDFMGEQQVKNIEEPVRAYHARLKPGADLPKPSPSVKAKPRRLQAIAIAATIALGVIGAGVLAWLAPWEPSEEPASIERMSFPLPEKPSIAVLPFSNFSDDPEQDYFADGITESVITELSRFRNLFVIAHNSTSSYKGKPMKARQVSEDLGVQYVLEGNVQRSKDRVRINVQLIDALTGRHLWGERYDKALNDVFAVQDEVTRQIVATLATEDGRLAKAWQERIALKGTESLNAYELDLRGWKAYTPWTKEAFARAEELFEKAIAADPDYARPYANLALITVYQVYSQFAPEESLGRAVELAEEAIARDDGEAWGHWALGAAYLKLGSHEQTVAEYERALELNPNDADVLAESAWPLTYGGRPEEGIENARRAMRLNPRYPDWYLWALGVAAYDARRYEEAVATLENRKKPNLKSNLYLAAAYAQLGRQNEAQVTVKKILADNPESSIEHWGKAQPYQYEAALNHYVDGLRKAGLPEKPSLPLPDKPSIAALPFTNMSGDPEQEYLSDGISENIITELSRFQEFFVIARQSSFSYKGKAVTIPQVGKELGVRYVAEGSLQRSGDSVRVTVQLIDALDGTHLWAERYDRDLTDLFALQDAIVRAVVGSLAEEVQMAEGERALRKHPSSLQAFEYVLRGRKLLRTINKESTEQARQMYEKAREIDPNYAEAYEGLSKVYNFAYRWRFLESVSRETAVKLGCEMAQTAVALQPFWYRGHWVLANCHMFRGELDQSLTEYERALALNPNSSEVSAAIGEPLVYLGRAEEAIVRYKAAIRLNPHHPDWFLWQMGWAQYLAGQYEEALTTIQRMARMPNAVRRTLAPILVRLGRLEEARTVMAEFITNNPDYSLEHVNAFPFRHTEYLQRWTEDLRIAGMPEKPRSTSKLGGS